MIRLTPNTATILTPAQFTERFGPSETDYAAVAQYARSAGLSIVGTHVNRTLIDVEGSATAIQNAFDVKLLLCRDGDGRVFRAPDADPLVPAGIAARINGIHGLDTVAERQPHIVARAYPFTSAVWPSQIGSGPNSGLAPSDIKTAYGLSSVTRTGAGQTLAVFELDGYTAGDITAYENHFGLGTVALQNVLVDGATGKPSASGGAAEVTLDIELAIAMAPGVSKILVYEGPNTDTGVLDTYNPYRERQPG